jgi:hypothetical protein
MNQGTSNKLMNRLLNSSSTNINIANTGSIVSNRLGRILLAESNLVTVDLLISQVVNYSLQYPSHSDDLPICSIAICNNAEDLANKLMQDPPDLLLLGKIEKAYWFDLCYACRQIDPNLPIVLLVEHQVIDDYFCRWAEVRGANAVVSNEPIELHRFFKIWYPLPSENEVQSNILNIRMMMLAIAEITKLSKSYVGTLAQGNYWRKTYDRLLNSFQHLKYWSADHFGNINCHEAALDCEVTAEDLYCLRFWIRLFIAECERAVPTFGKILTTSYLSPVARQLLLT